MREAVGEHARHNHVHGQGASTMGADTHTATTARRKEEKKKKQKDRAAQSHVIASGPNNFNNSTQRQ